MNGPGRERISNKELEFLENQIAASNRITRIVALAAEEIDDTETLELLDDISATADRLRTTAIAWMHKCKKENHVPPNS